MSAYIYSITFLTKGEYVMNMKKLSMFSDQAEDIKLGDMENWLDQEIANTSDQSIKEELKKHYNNISNIRTFYAQHQYNKHQEEKMPTLLLLTFAKVSQKNLWRGNNVIWCIWCESKYVQYGSALSTSKAYD
jgi:hypothetical protein